MSYSVFRDSINFISVDPEANDDVNKGHNSEDYADCSQDQIGNKKRGSLFPTDIESFTKTWKITYVIFIVPFNATENGMGYYEHAVCNHFHYKKCS